MLLAWLVSFITVITLAFSSYGPSLIQRADNKLRTIAGQMAVAHDAAVVTCESGCASGFVNVTSNLPPEAQGGTVYGTSIRSFSNGSGMVVTLYMPMVDNPQLINGNLGGHLMAVTQSPFTAGTYDATSQRVGGQAPSVAGGTPTYFGIAVPQGVGGVTLPNGVPLLASNIN